MGNLIGSRRASEITAPTTQVYKATHKGDGLSLPFMHRSFISFSYGGRNIEDFGLIAVTDGDRLNRKGYADFEDVTENHEVYDGQLYWGTHFKNNSLELDLATDGITERQLDEFKSWFRPGTARELILAEHPNRAIMARVSEQPELELLPFQSYTKTRIRNIDFNTSTTMYKGEVKLSFVMDEPYWYAKYNLITPVLMGEGPNGTINLKENAYTLKNLLDTNYLGSRLSITYKNTYGNIINDTITLSNVEVDEAENHTDEVLEGHYWHISGTLQSDGAVKTLYYPDDIISLKSGVITLTGADDYENSDYAKIISEDNIPHLAMISDNNTILLGQNIAVQNVNKESKIFNNLENNVDDLKPNEGARIQFYGYIDIGAVTWKDSFTLGINKPLYLYYSGNAPSKPILNFTLVPYIDDNGAGFLIDYPYNRFSKISQDINEILRNKDYHYIQIGDQKFRFTISSLMTGYNQAIMLINDFANSTIEELIASAREKIGEYYSRTWAIYAIKKVYTEKNGILPETPEQKGWYGTEIKKLFFKDEDGKIRIPCTFNSKTGEATARFKIFTPDNLNDPIEIEQNVGDMVKSNYPIIDERCYPSSNGYITERNCIKITTNYPEYDLENFSLSFQNMYY